MILIDFNQVFIANLMQHLKNDPKQDIDENEVRIMVMNSLRLYLMKFKNKYGKAVICCDSKSYWRRKIFPFYKMGRKKTRQDSGFNWPAIFDALDKVKNEFKNSLPYKVIEVDGAEADDIIAVLAMRYSAHEDVMILSSDKDFMQLQKLSNVQQYNPVLAQYVSTNDPHAFLKEHIIRGDRGDGIPNILSPDNVLVVDGARQKSVMKEKVKTWLAASPDEFCTTDDMKHGYARNRILVDFEYIPAVISSEIVAEFEKPNNKTKMDLLGYLMAHRMKNLVESVSDF